MDKKYTVKVITDRGSSHESNFLNLMDMWEYANRAKTWKDTQAIELITNQTIYRKG